MLLIKSFLIFWLIFFIISSTNLASSHVCDDVLRQDPIVIWPEKETIKTTKTGQFKIFLKNDYFDSINKVRIIIPPSPFEISITPNLIEKITSGEKIFFSVNFIIPEKVKSGLYSLLLKVNAREFTIDREVNLKIQVERPIPEIQPAPKIPEIQPEPEAMIKIIPEDIPIAISVFPDVIEVKRGEVIKFKIFVRNGHPQPLHNLKVFIPKEPFKILNVEPKLIEKIQFNEIAFFKVTLAIPKEKEIGNYPLFIEIGAKELPLARQTSLVIKVREVKSWIPYLQFSAILFLIVFMIWRWRGVTRKRSELLPKQ